MSELEIDANGDVAIRGSLQIPFGGERGLVAKLDRMTGHGTAPIEFEDPGDSCLIPLWDNWLL